ncbi:hypothetical protein [Streptomyces sp. NPDC089919]|uniref:hypothetical protein n=1 Tax=Streptomyces sp. NPDC089919 TaxID=3155188 RepID=UPI003449D6F5
MRRKYWWWAGAVWVLLVVAGGGMTMYLKADEGADQPGRWERMDPPEPAPIACAEVGYGLVTREDTDEQDGCAYWARE